VSPVPSNQIGSLTDVDVPGGGTVATGQRRVRLDREERQRQLIEANKELIATKGYADTSLRDVAARIGISTGTLLHHFQSKEDFLAATLVSVGEEFLVHMRSVVGERLDPARKLRKLARAVFKSPRHDVGWRVWIAFWHEAAVHPELASVASGLTERAEMLFTQVIEEGVRAGVFRSSDPSLSASQLAVLIDGIAIRLYGEIDGWSVKRAQQMIDQFIADLEDKSRAS
jgi:AcrR family transcriptional regulator